MADESTTPIETTEATEPKKSGEAELGSEQNPLSSQQEPLEGGQEISDLEPGLGVGPQESEDEDADADGDDFDDDLGDSSDSEGEEDETVDAEDLEDDDFSEHIANAGNKVFDEGKARENVGKIRNQGTTIEFIEILTPRQPALEAAMRAEATARALADGSLKPEDHPAKDGDGPANPNSGGDADKGNSITSATEPTDDEAVNPSSGPVHIGIGGQTAPSPIAPKDGGLHPDVKTDPLPDDPAGVLSDAATSDASAEAPAEAPEAASALGEEASAPAERESTDSQADGFKPEEGPGEESPEKPNSDGSAASTEVTDGSDAPAAVSGNLPTTPNIQSEFGESKNVAEDSDAGKGTN